MAELPKGARITDYISWGVITKTFPLTKVKAVVAAAGKTNQRHRDLPAPVVVYYVIALALYRQASYREVLRCWWEGMQWLLGPGAAVKVAGQSGISQARSRLGGGAVQQLPDEVVRPMAVKATKGAWYPQWRWVSLDGSTMEVADEKENEEALGRPGASRGSSAYPQIRLVSLVENGTHVWLGSNRADYHTGEITLAQAVLPRLRKGMLCLADRQFLGFQLWNQARARGADWLWRVQKNLRLTCEKRLPDGSYRSRVYPSERDGRHQTNGVVGRVLDYRLEGVAGAEPIYRRITTLRDPEQAPALELAALDPERGEIETALDELKTHRRGSAIVLRSKTPDWVRPEFCGRRMAHFALRGLLQEAALKAGEDPDRLSFLHAVRVVRRKLAQCSAIPPSAQEDISGERAGGDPARASCVEPQSTQSARRAAQDEQLPTAPPPSEATAADQSQQGDQDY